MNPGSFVAFLFIRALGPLNAPIQLRALNFDTFPSKTMLNSPILVDKRDSLGRGS
jgi:hypothetical protein